MVFGVNTGLLAVLATRAVPYANLRWEWIPIGLTLVLLGLSFWHLYREAFPTLEGGQESLLYFREIIAIEQEASLSERNIQHLFALGRKLVERLPEADRPQYGLAARPETFHSADAWATKRRVQ